MLVSSLILCARLAAVLSFVNPPQPEPSAILLDGSFDDWPATGGGGVSLLADRRYLYLRLDLPVEMTLQASDGTTRLLLDLDASASTGMPPSAQGDAEPPFGADLEVLFSPPARPGQTRRSGGVAIWALTSGGARVAVPQDTAELMFSPTYAARTFEVRISRTFRGVALLDPLRMATAAAATLQFLDADGKVTGSQSPSLVILPALADVPSLADLDVPRTPEGAVRVLSWNVHRAAPMANPESFARVLNSLRPDIVLVQEWEKTTPEELAAWFDKHVAQSDPWHALMSAGWGVGIVARFPLDRLGPERVERPGNAPGDSSRPDTALRFVGALVHTDRADAAVASIHLKCCGSKDGREDLARMAEARLINERFAAALRDSPAPIRLIAGDYNLVGSRPPLDLLRTGLDLDGSELAVAEPRVLGDRTFTTWADPTTPFTPGRLDYAVYSDSTASAAQTFILDTTLLSDAALQRAGLQRLDSRASDHMPLVIDLKPGP